jgi:hypothetical protein
MLAFLFDGRELAVTYFLSGSKSQSQYLPFKVAMFFTKSQSPHDPHLPVDYEFKLPDTGHW